ncbi:MAG: RNA methyltransferase [Epsilonproteobacteria bacterium]|nr:MAG: RNA methyltransferase [Campylobacterota bacterium]RLA65134.1 MAG: RNA methyltransferase [Campylobacterota bacterium]
MRLYLGLVHSPIKNKRGEIVTTSVTNLDIHDISRSCKTFGVEKFFLVTPLKAQHELVGRILGHWKKEQSLVYNPDRQEALAVAQLVNNIEESKLYIKNETGQDPLVVVTGANFNEYSGEVKDLYAALKIDNRPVLLLFGTGYGLADSVLEDAHFSLEPINGPGDYNHLSVRSAVAIYLDRIQLGSF